jgi:hypothetical protein
MDMKKQWKEMAEKAGKQAEIHFFMADNARTQKQPQEEDKQLKKQIEELEKQYEYMKNVSNLNIYSCIDKYAVHPTK